MASLDMHVWRLMDPISGRPDYKMKSFWGEQYSTIFNRIAKTNIRSSEQDGYWFATSDSDVFM